MPRSQKKEQDTPGVRLARLRQERGFTQTELRERLGISQAMLSAYERGEVRLHAEIIARLAEVLRVSADQIVGLNETKTLESRTSRKLLRRIEQIERLPKRKQDVLVNTIDTFLKGAAS